MFYPTCIVYKLLQTFIFFVQNTRNLYQNYCSLKYNLNNISVRAPFFSILLPCFKWKVIYVKQYIAQIYTDRVIIRWRFAMHYISILVNKQYCGKLRVH